MKKKTSLFVIPILLLALSACGAPPAPTATVEVVATPTAAKIPLTEAEVPRISLEQAKAAIESGAAIVVDVRSQDAFNASHIPGAINIQLGEFETNIAGLALDKEQWIITYCT